MTGHLITISGLDGAGKSTQLQMLRSRLDSDGERCVSYQFTAGDYGPAAAERIESFVDEGARWVFTRHSIDWTDRYPLIRDFVYSGELQTPALAKAVALVFAGGAVQVAQECIAPLLDHGINVICDRYWYDDLVFRSPWLDGAFVRDLYSTLPVPATAFYLDVDAVTAAQRNRLRDDGRSPLLRDHEAVGELRRRFRAIADEFQMRILDATRSPDEVQISLVHQLHELRVSV